MSVTIQIGSQIIDFPSTGSSPLWSPAVIDFAQAVEEALRGTFGPYDVAPQILNIDVANPTPSPVDINNLNFPPSQVLSVTIKYAVFRSTDSMTVTETGSLLAIYNNTNPLNSKWEISRESVGDALIDFIIQDNGQVQYSTDVLSGLNHTGKIVFSAQCLLQS